MDNKNIRSLLISLTIPLITGAASSLATANNMASFMSVEKPSFSPPAILFPIVWTVLYLLMGFASYLIVISDTSEKLRNRALMFYGIQLILNYIWPILFFNRQNFFLAFLWLLLLWIFILITLILFYQINKLAGLLLIPYLLWVSFAGVLNYAIWQLNKNI